MLEETYDVVVIGGGHAACEAAFASANSGAKTLLLTIDPDRIAQMSCNPCIGGIAKGHVVREIDALGGAMGRVAEASSLQFRMLNRTKGPAVWSPRAQCDKACYSRAMKFLLERTANLTIRLGTAASFVTEGDTVCGVVTSMGHVYRSRAVVTATGTFLRGKMHYGLQDFPGGRSGDPPSVELSYAIRDQLKLHMGRLKTGTPPRILASSVDFSRLSVQGGDSDEERFCFFPSDGLLEPHTSNRAMLCHTTYSNAETASLVRANLDKAPMYNGLIEGIGTRYCPSFEDKVVRFPSHERHLIYLEPEGEYTLEYYVNGISTSLPPEIQVAMLRTLPGLENVSITRYAYAIEYDFVYPEELDRTLSVRRWHGLYHAGQINGTSGYEEAAAQGLVAGLNASRHARGLAGIEFGRDESYIGVMIDDLVTKEITEPYRLFTSRAEYRLSMRQDNADLRLTEKGHSLGLVSDEMYGKFVRYRELLESAEGRLAEIRLSGGRSGLDVLHSMRGIINDVSELPFEPAALGLDMSDFTHRRVLRELAVRAHYAGYIRQEERSVRNLRSLELWTVPGDFDYSSIRGLRNETRMKLEKIRPTTLAQASRIDGMTPAETGLLQVHLSRLSREKAGK